MNEKGVITDIKQLTPERLTNIFKKKGYLSKGKVTKIKKRNSRETFTSYVHFLELNFSNGAQMEGASPEIVMKIPKSVNMVKLVGSREVKFYSIVAETMNEMPIPTCYDAVFSEETSGSYIILDDLSKTHIGLKNFPMPPSKRYCERAIDCLAEIHAFWWDYHKLKELSKHVNFIHILKENSFIEEEIYKQSKKQNRTLKRFLKLLGDRISYKRKELFKTIFSLFPQFSVERIKKKENITLIHGDAHFWNFFYPKDIENEKYKTLLFDWQSWSIGVGGQDLAYMIGLRLYPDYRHLIEKVLIKRYHNDLLKFGVKNYSWDDCWYDYRLGALFNLYRIVGWWSVNLHPSIWWPALEISFLTIEDLNCMELLERKI